MKRRNLTLALTSTLLLLGGGPVSAAVIIQASENAGNVVFTATGSANLAALTLSESGVAGTDVNPTIDLVIVFGGSFFGYSGIIAPANLPFGTKNGNRELFGSSGSGTGPVGIGKTGSTPILRLPQNYVSGGVISASTTFNNQTFASFNEGTLTPGSYTWTWGESVNADSLTLHIGPVPEPSIPILLGLGALGLIGKRRRRCRSRNEE